MKRVITVWVIVALQVAIIVAYWNKEKNYSKCSVNFLANK